MSVISGSTIDFSPSTPPDPTTDAGSTMTFTTIPGLPPLPSTLCNEGGVFLCYGQSISYGWDNGLRPAPVAGPKGGPLVDFVRVHSGMCVKTINAVGVRIGDTVKMPHFDT